MIAVTGFTKQSMRQIKIYDPRKIPAPGVGGRVKANKTVDIDKSAGVMMMHYDYDNSVLYLAGKGDSSVKYFEMVDTAPYIHFLSQYSDNQSTKGFCWLPKKHCVTTDCEIASTLRVLRDSVVPVHFIVPRKTGADMFQSDIYPDTAAPVPAQDSKSYFGGADVDPILMSMKPGEGLAAAATEIVKKKTYAELEAELEAANKRIAELEAQLAAQ